MNKITNVLFDMISVKHPMVENLNQILISKSKHVSSLQID